MPLVKRWQPRAEPAPMPSVSPVTQDWSGVAAVQRASLHAADVLADVAVTEARKANDARVTQQTADFDRAANELLLNPEVDAETGKPKGYKLLNGEDAFSKRNDYAAKVQELQTRFRERLASDTQREMFDRHTSAKVTGYLAEIDGHAGKAADAAQKAAFKLGQEANLATALNFAGSPALRGPALEGIRRDAEKQAAREGLDPVAAARFADDQAASASAAVVQRLARDNPAEARNFFDTVNAKSGFGVYVAKAEEAVRAGTLKDTANMKTLEILATTSGDSTQALALAEAIPNVEERDEVVQRVTQHFSQKHSMEAAKDIPAEGRLVTKWLTGKGFSRTDDDYQGLSDQGKRSIEERWYAFQQSKTEKGSTEQAAAMAEFLFTYPERMAEYGSMGFSKFTQEWGGRLAPKDFERAAGHVSQFGVAARKTDETLPPWAVKAINVEGGADRGALWGTKGPKTADQVATYNLIFQDLLAEQQRLKLAGKPLDEATVKARLTYWTTKGTVKDTGLISDDSGVPRAKAAAVTAYEGKAFVEDLPKKHREELKKANLAAGLPTNDAWLRWTYNNALGIPDDQNPVPPKPPPPPAPLRGLTGLSD